jgi:hypothetical protein
MKKQTLVKVCFIYSAAFTNLNSKILFYQENIKSNLTCFTATILSVLKALAPFNLESDWHGKNILF